MEPRKGAKGHWITGRGMDRPDEPVTNCDQSPHANGHKRNNMDARGNKRFRLQRRSARSLSNSPLYRRRLKLNTHLSSAVRTIQQLKIPLCARHLRGYDILSGRDIVGQQKALFQGGKRRKRRKNGDRFGVVCISFKLKRIWRHETRSEAAAEGQFGEGSPQGLKPGTLLLRLCTG